jgi:hypothetical protein
VYLLIGVQIDESLDNRLEYTGNFILIELLLRDIDEIDDASGLAELEDDPEVVVLPV